MLYPDDLAPGQFCTVHRGHRVNCPCGCGGRGPEPYERIKGVPLAVLAVNLPYVITAIVQGQAAVNVILDVRECDLCAVSDAYVKAFAGSATDKQEGGCCGK